MAYILTLMCPSYHDTVEYLYNQLPVFQNIGAGAYKPGLGTAYALAEAFGNPHLGLRSVHVAGTNGKGSTSHSIASVLMAAGYKVGLYTSPHLFDFRERIRVSGEMITEEAVVDFVDRYRAMNLKVNPSFFELTTIMAFDYFRAMDVDVAVVEVGLGGRLDTTNIITPLLSVITNVSLDHVAQLGSSIEQIASEKAGIIKPGVPVVIGEAHDAEHRIFERRAAELGAPISFAQDTPLSHSADASGHHVFALRQGEAPSVVCDLQGSFQVYNINTIIHALRALEPALCIPDEAVREGLANVQQRTGLMGRWTTLRTHSPRVICDTGHNIGAWQHLAPQLSQLAHSASALRVVIGFVNDKDVDAIFRLLPAEAVYYLVQPSVKRARPSADLLRLAEERGLVAKAYATVSEGYKAALADAGDSDVVFVGGSNYVIAELK